MPFPPAQKENAGGGNARTPVDERFVDQGPKEAMLFVGQRLGKRSPDELMGEFPEKSRQLEVGGPYDPVRGEEAGRLVDEICERLELQHAVLDEHKRLGELDAQQVAFDFQYL